MFQASTDLLVHRARAVGAIRPHLTTDDLRRLLCGVEHALHAGPVHRATTARYLSVLLTGVATASDGNAHA